MKFLKNFFDDDSNMIGLCGFKLLTPKYNTSPIEKEIFFNPFDKGKIFQTNFTVNTLLT